MCGEKGLFVRACDFRFRITPACAGKRVFLSVPATSVLGSPPHVRGKAGNGSCGNVKIGITPACAGKSLRRASVCFAKRDHPRMCGEKFFKLLPHMPFHGSPPHVRGKVTGLPHLQGTVRITPACAGKST